MPERFVSLASLLAERRVPAVPAPETVVAEEPQAAPPPRAASECALFHARLREAFERTHAALLRDLAADVLARELRLAPADVEALARRLLERARDETPVAVRVSPSDRARIALDLPIETDPALRPGDVVLVVRDGTLESTLGVRLEALVHAVPPE